MWENSMLYLNNPLLTAQGIVDLYSKETKKSSRSLSAAEIVRKKLKSLFSPNQTINDAEIHSVWIPRFHEFPQYQDILTKVFSSSVTTISLDENLSQGISPDLNAINAEFRYFREVKQDLLDLHHQLDIACRKILILEDQAYQPDMAYKLMVLFYNPALNIQDNMAEIATHFAGLFKGMKEQPRPYHDVLITELRTLPTPVPENIEAWKQFVKQYGFHALKYFRDAISIGRTPASLQEADRLAIHHRYTRAGENLDFANLCKHHHVDEDTFNASLDYIAEGWPKKTIDSLPVVDIADEDGQYFLVKLNPADPRALFLGNITNCCQHMGGHSEFCVREGVSLKHNGFYVLLKSKTNPAKPRLINGEIDDKHFTVVAQSYAWRTQNDNLCLDSIEFKVDLVSKEKIREMMQIFSASVLETNPEIKYITVGSGGQTPDDFGPAVKVAEKILLGQQYYDSTNQMIIAARKVPVAETSPYLSYIYPYLQEGMLADFPKNILDIDSQAEEKITSKLRLLLSFSQELSLTDFAPLSLEYYLQLSDDEKQSVSILQKIWNMNTYEDALNWWPHLSQDEQIKILIQLQFSSDSFLKLLLQKQNISFIKNILQSLPYEWLVAEIKKLDSCMNELHLSAFNADRFLLQISKLNDLELKQQLVARSSMHETPLQWLDITPDIITILYRRLGKPFFIELFTNTDIVHEQQILSLLDKVISTPTLLNRLMLLDKSPRWLLTDEKEMQTCYYPLHAAASNWESFQLLWSCYPNAEEKKAAISRLNRKNQNVLRYAVSNPQVLQAIFDLYSDDLETFKTLLEHNNGILKSTIYFAIENPKSLAIILPYIDINQMHQEHAVSYPESMIAILSTCASTEIISSILSQNTQCGKNLFTLVMKQQDDVLLHEIYNRFYRSQSDDFLALFIACCGHYSNIEIYGIEKILSMALNTNAKRFEFLLNLFQILDIWVDFLDICSPDYFERMLQGVSSDEIITLLKKYPQIGCQKDQFWLQIVSKFQEEPEKMIELLQLKSEELFCGPLGFFSKENTILSICIRGNIGMDIIQSCIGTEEIKKLSKIGQTYELSLSQHSLFNSPAGRCNQVMSATEVCRR
jgi:hypothetical protein